MMEFGELKYNNVKFCESKQDLCSYAVLNL